MKPSLKPTKIAILLSLILPATFGFAPVVETKTIQNTNKEQIGILKAGKVTEEVIFARLNDNYYKIARRFGLSSRYLMSLNNVKSPYLKVKEPVILSRLIEPSSSHNGLIINLPEKKLYHFSNGKLLQTYGVAVGKPSTETPMGNFSILYKTKAPSWYIPVSIQKEMAARGKPVKNTVVPPGPGNPLGNWWMAIGSGIGIHSTNAPSSIGYSVSHGCIRMKPKSAEDLFKKVKVKTLVKIVYQPVKIGVDNNNNVYLEAYRDMYYRNINYTTVTDFLLKQSNLEGNINWSTVYQVLKAKQGIPVLISKAINTTTPLTSPTTKPTVEPTESPSLNPTSSPESEKHNIKPTNKPGDVNPYIPTTNKPIDIIVTPKPKPTVTPTPTVNPTLLPSPSVMKPSVVPTHINTIVPQEGFIDTTHPR